MSAPDPSPPPRRFLALKFALFLTLVAAAALAFHFSPLGRSVSLASLRTWLESVRARWWAGPAFALLYTAGCLAAVPGSPMSVAGALAFGPWWGIVWVVAGSNLGLNATFLVSRFLGKGWIDQKLQGRRLDDLNARLAQHGLLRVLQLRLIPAIPFNLLNYACGLTRVRWRDYALGSFLGMLPLNIAYVWAAGAVGEALLSADPSPEARRAKWLSLGLALLLFAVVSCIPLILKRLRRPLADPPPAGRNE